MPASPQILAQDFKGLDLKSEVIGLDPMFAIVADDVITQKNRVIPRLGRKLIATEQYDPGTVYGIAAYSPTTENFRSIVMVNKFGIVQRKF